MDLFANTASDGFFIEFAQKMFQPLLLFFYAGFLIPIIGVPYEFPQQVYQGITLYLLVAIGWHGGEELARMSGGQLVEAGGFIVIGFCINTLIGLGAYLMLRAMTRMRKIDAATVGGYYGSDSAGTFMTCIGVLVVMGYKSFGFMPVLLAVMEMPGCLVSLFLVARLRRKGMDRHGNMPNEPGYQCPAEFASKSPVKKEEKTDSVAATEHHRAPHSSPAGGRALFDWHILHEVFFNPGLYFLFVGIFIGLISGLLFIRYDKASVISSENLLFITLMHGVLCLFLLEMGITASKRLRDLKEAGVGFVVFGLVAPNLFAIIGMIVVHAYSMILGRPFPLPTYALFAVLCAAASYIAVPAVQRMAIPEASPTLPLAASLGLTFTWNVTLGIPIYIAIAQFMLSAMPVGS